MSSFQAHVDAAQFREALDHVLRFAAKRSSIPILGEAMVSFKDGRCVLTCTNLSQWCIATLPAAGDSFSFVFSGSQAILTACKYFSGELEFLYTVESTVSDPDPAGQIFISDGKRSLKRSTERASDFPVFQDRPMERHFPVNPKKLLERFNRIKYAVDETHSRDVLRCIEFVDDKIIAVDGYRVALSADPALSVGKPFFIPPKVLSELSIFKDKDCTISVGKEWAALENEALRVITRTPEYDGFDVEKAIPSSLSTEYSVDVTHLLEGLKYLNGLASKKDRKPVQFDGHAFTLETPGGTYFAEVGLPHVEVRGFHPRYLLEGFEQFKAKNAHTVTMKMGSPHSPLILTDGQDDLAMILPVRLKNAA